MPTDPRHRHQSTLHQNAAGDYLGQAERNGNDSFRIDGTCQVAMLSLGYVTFPRTCLATLALPFWLTERDAAGFSGLDACGDGGLPHYMVPHNGDIVGAIGD